MPIFGDFETFGEPVAIAEDRDQVTTVWRASKRGGEGDPRFAVKCYSPHRRKTNPAQPEEALDADPANEFLECIKQLKKAQTEGGSFLVPIHGYGFADEGAWYATDFYPRKELKAWIAKRGGVDGAALRQLVQSVVTGCLALKRLRGFSHGNLKPANVLLAGKPRPLRHTPLHLADPYPAAPLQLARYAGDECTVDESRRKEIEKQDLRALGELLLQLVEGRFVNSAYDYNFPVPASPVWAHLGRDGERWRELCNRLLDPQLSLDKVNLESLAQEVRPGVGTGKLLVLAGVVGGVCVLGGVVYWIFRPPTTVVISENQPPSVNAGPVTSERTNEAPSVTKPVVSIPPPDAQQIWQDFVQGNEFKRVVQLWSRHDLERKVFEEIVHHEFDGGQPTNSVQKLEQKLKAFVFDPPSILASLSAADKKQELSALGLIAKGGGHDVRDYAKWANDLKTNYGPAKMTDLLPVWATELVQTNFDSFDRQVGEYEKQLNLIADKKNIYTVEFTPDALRTNLGSIFKRKTKLESDGTHDGANRTRLQNEGQVILKDFAKFGENLKKAIKDVGDAINTLRIEIGKRGEDYKKAEKEAEKAISGGNYDQAFETFKKWPGEERFKKLQEQAMAETNQLRQVSEMLKAGEYDPILSRRLPENSKFKEIRTKAGGEKKVFDQATGEFADGKYDFLQRPEVLGLRSKPPFQKLLQDGEAEAGHLKKAQGLQAARKPQDALDFLAPLKLQKTPFAAIQQWATTELERAGEQRDQQSAEADFRQGEYSKALELCRKHSGIAAFDALSKSIGEEQGVLTAAGKKFSDGNYSFIKELEGPEYRTKPPFAELLSNGVKEQTVLGELESLKSAGDWPTLQGKLGALPSDNSGKKPFEVLRQWALQKAAAEANAKSERIAQLNNELECFKVWFGLKSNAKQVTNPAWHRDKGEKCTLDGWRIQTPKVCLSKLAALKANLNDSTLEATFAKLKGNIENSASE